MFKLDHIIIAVDDLDTAIENYRALGFNAFYGGRHANTATHNALICFADGSYLELLAPTGEPPLPGMADFSPLLLNGEGLTGYALLSHDLIADADELRARGALVGDVADGRRKRADGIELHWRTANVEGGKSPFLIEDVTPRSLRVPDDLASITHPNGVTGVAKLEGADFEGTRGNLRLTALILAAPTLIAFDPTRTHNVKLDV